MTTHGFVELARDGAGSAPDGARLRTVLYGRPTSDPATIAIMPPDDRYPVPHADPDTRFAQAVEWARGLDARFTALGLTPPRFLVCHAEPAEATAVAGETAEVLRRWRAQHPDNRLMLAADPDCFRTALTAAHLAADFPGPAPVTAILTPTIRSTRAQMPGEEVPLIGFGAHKGDLRGAWRRATTPPALGTGLRSPYPFFGEPKPSELRRVRNGLNGPPAAVQSESQAAAVTAPQHAPTVRSSRRTGVPPTGARRQGTPRAQPGR